MIKSLFIDIETSPNIVFSWGLGRKIFLSPDNLIQERAIICACYKWAHSFTIHSLVWKRGNDRLLLQKLSLILNQADEIITQNGDKYDLKFINARLAYHNLPPISLSAHSDTLKMVKKAMLLNSNKLDYIGQFFKLGRKQKSEYTWWKDVVLLNCKKSLALLVKYCKQDVALLEKVYKKISKYSPPNIHKSRYRKGRFIYKSGLEACPVCAHEKPIGDGYYYSSKGIIYNKWRCRKCGATFRSLNKRESV